MAFIIRQPDDPEATEEESTDIPSTDRGNIIFPVRGSSESDLYELDIGDLVTYLNGVLAGFKLYDDVPDAVATIAAADRFVLSDVSRADNANRYITLSALRAAILDPQFLTAITEVADDDLFAIYSDDEDEARSVSLADLIAHLNDNLTFPASATFDLHEDVGTALTSPADDDRLVVSDESETGEPNRYITLSTLISYLFDGDNTLTGIEALSGSDLTDAQDHLGIGEVDAANVLLALKDFNDDQISAAQFALSLVSGISSFNSLGTYTANTLNTSHDGGVYIPTIDEVWIADNADNRIYRYETDGTDLGVFNTDSSNSSPLGLAYIESIDEVWVIDGSNIHRYGTDRSYIGTHASGFTGQALTGIAYDKTRDIVIILNDTANRIYFYNTDGTWTNAQMDLDSNNSNASGITYYEPLDEIWVADNTDNQIYKYSGEDRTLFGTETLDSNNDDCRFIAYISATEEIWVGQNPSVNIYRYNMEVSIDRDKIIDAFENFSSSQLSDTQDALGISNVRVVENSEVTYASGNPQTISITGPDAEIGDIVIFQYRSSFTPGIANVTLQVGNDDRDQIRILATDGSLRWLTLNDLTRYAIYVMFRADGVWQYIGGTRNTPTPPFDLHDHVTTRMTAPAAADRLVASDEGESGDPNRYLTIGDLATFINDIHERISTAMTAPHADDRIPISDESDTGDPTEYVTVETLATYFLDLHERLNTELTTIADNDRIAITDESANGDPTRYATADRLRTAIGTRYHEWNSPTVTNLPSGATLDQFVGHAFETGDHVKFDAKFRLRHDADTEWTLMAPRLTLPVSASTPSDVVGLVVGYGGQEDKFESLENFPQDWSFERVGTANRFGLSTHSTIFGRQLFFDGDTLYLMLTLGLYTLDTTTGIATQVDTRSGYVLPNPNGGWWLFQSGASGTSQTYSFSRYDYDLTNGNISNGLSIYSTDFDDVSQTQAPLASASIIYVYLDANNDVYLQGYWSGDTDSRVGYGVTRSGRPYRKISNDTVSNFGLGTDFPRITNTKLRGAAADIDNWRYSYTNDATLGYFRDSFAIDAHIYPAFDDIHGVAEKDGVLYVIHDNILYKGKSADRNINANFKGDTYTTAIGQCVLRSTNLIEAQVEKLEQNDSGVFLQISGSYEK